MKSLKINGIIAAIVAIFINSASFAQTSPNTIDTATFTVSGNCEMCKKRIETAALTSKGVKTAVWNDATQAITVTYKAGKTTPDAIGKSIAAAGYDNAHATANPDAYKKLPTCCRYTRDKK
jgi:copper chaperone CopZ